MIERESKMTFWQRFCVGIVAAVMVLSTVALFAGLVLSNQNQEKDLVTETEERARLTELLDAYYAEVDGQAAVLSEQYFTDFKKHRLEVKAYNAANAEAMAEIKVRDLKVGKGKEITQEIMDAYEMEFYEDETTLPPYSAYYIGWLADGTVFDSSFNEDETGLNFPLAGGTGYIAGWLEGVIGMRIGGVREVTIPSLKGYGTVDQGVIPPNSPLKFIIMLVDPRATPEPGDELIELYAKYAGIQG
jgi:FKBP-type peptidyl-prolyl cis-trans isomerase